MFSSFMVTSYVMAPVTASTCIALEGLLPQHGWLIVKMGAVSTLPWMKRTSRKKELGAVVCPPPISLESGAVGVITGDAPRVLLGLGAFFSLCRVIHIHTRAGEVDNGVRHAREVVAD